MASLRLRQQLEIRMYRQTTVGSEKNTTNSITAMLALLSPEVSTCG
jgi:hypothetical protein